MLIDRPEVTEGSAIINATVPSGTSFPTLPNIGELFYLTAGSIGLYTYSGSAWIQSANFDVIDGRINSVRDDLIAHKADDTRHLTGPQNTLLDGINGVGFTDINKLNGLATFLQAQPLTDYLNTPKPDADKLSIDGSIAMTGNLKMGAKRITGMAEPLSDSDAATKNYVDLNPGIPGPQGEPLRMLGSLNSEDDLPPDAEVGDCYLIGSQFWLYREGTGWEFVSDIGGPDGKSAYQIAQENGFGGTPNEWLESLTGQDGIGLNVRGSRNNVGELPTSGNQYGDTYIIQDKMYVYTGPGTGFQTVGQVGATGKSAYEVAVAAGFQGDLTAWLASLKGATGDRGLQGLKGDKGDKGDAGVDGVDGLAAPAVQTIGTLPDPSQLPTTGQEGDAYVIGEDLWYWVVDHYVNVGKFQGPKGDTGAQGPNGLKGDKGDKGDTGSTGPQGVTGRDNYQIAVANGFQGTEAQWLAQAMGPKGDTGDKGEKGDGLLAAGTVATVNQLPAAVDNKGKVISALDTGILYISNGSTWPSYGPLRGATGATGDTGPQGLKGDKGDKGDLGSALAPKGPVANAAALPTATPVNTGDFYSTLDDGHLRISNGSIWLDYGALKGLQGIQGPQGNVGPQGGPGNAFKYKGIVATQSALPSSGNAQADAYIATDSNRMFIYDGTGFVDAGKQGGANAYELAVSKGFSGDLSAWIASLKGETGAMGPEGEVGDEGPVGPDGIQGPIGETGPMGPALRVLGKVASSADLPPTGNTAGDGYIIGLNFWGWDGTEWLDLGVFAGPKGDKGEPGVRGSTGLAGARGLTGAKGDRGTIWISFARAPDILDGTTGDFYVNSTTNDYYVKMNSTTWQPLGNLGSGNVFDAPSDSVTRVRRNGAWIPLVFPVNEAPIDAGTYVRRNGAWVAIAYPVGEAPTDNKPYVRQNSAWLSFEAPLDSAYYSRQNGAWVATPTPTAFNYYTMKITAATTTLDLAQQQVFTVSASANRTLTFANVPAAGRAMTVVVKVSGNAGVITWPAGITWSGNIQPSLGTVFTTVILFWDGSAWTGSVGATA